MAFMSGIVPAAAYEQARRRRARGRGSFTRSSLVVDHDAGNAAGAVPARRRIFCAILLLAGCGGSSSPPEAMMAVGDLRATPWPSDVLLGSDGRLTIAPPFPFSGQDASISLLANALSELDGFGTVTAVFFPVSAPVVVDAGAAASVIDLDGDDPPHAYPLLYRAATRQLVALPPPGTVLREHHRYGCVVVDGVHDDAGRPLRPAKAMADLLAGGAAAPAAYQLLAAKLTAPPQAATAFTTRTVSSWVTTAIADLATMPPIATPTRSFEPGGDMDNLFGGPVTTTRPGRPPSGGVLHDHVARVVEGTFPSPDYLSAVPGQPGLFDDVPAPKSVGAVPFMLVLPKDTAAPPPVAIFQHGIDGDRSTMLLVADDYAARGYALLGIDAPFHGSRQAGAVDDVNNLSGMPIPDGIGDPNGLPVAAFFDFSGDPQRGIAPVDPRVMRDNLRQATVDLMQTVRLVTAGDWSAISGVTLDTTAPIYTGASFGGILGANVVAVDPLVSAAVLASAGGGLFTEMFGNSPTLSVLVVSLLGQSYDSSITVDHPDTDPVRAQMSLNLIETLIEPGDGLALTGAARPPKSLLLLEAFNDEVIANHATEALAAAWGASQLTLPGTHPTRVVTLPSVAPPYAASPLRALVQLAPACHTTYTIQQDTRAYADGAPPFVALATPMTVDNPIETAHRLALDFMDSFRRGAPTVGGGNP
jgi:dienelactone hydrolase